MYQILSQTLNRSRWWVRDPRIIRPSTIYVLISSCFVGVAVMHMLRYCCNPEWLAFQSRPCAARVTEAGALDGLLSKNSVGNLINFVNFWVFYGALPGAPGLPKARTVPGPAGPGWHCCERCCMLSTSVTVRGSVSLLRGVNWLHVNFWTSSQQIWAEKRSWNGYCLHCHWF